MPKKDYYLPMGALILGLLVLTAVLAHAQAKPVWVGHDCGASETCVTDVLNTLYADRAVDAKVTVYANDCWNCIHYWVWYRQ